MTERVASASDANGKPAGLETPDAQDTSEEFSGPARILVHPIVEAALRSVWPAVKPMIREAVRWSPITSRLETINDVEAKVAAGEYKLWCVFKGGEIIGAVITSIAEHSRCRVLDVHYGAGDDLHSWFREMHATLDEEAVETDCRFIRIMGRDGWAKFGDELGYQKAFSVLMKDV